MGAMDTMLYAPAPAVPVVDFSRMRRFVRLGALAALVVPVLSVLQLVKYQLSCSGAGFDDTTGCFGEGLFTWLAMMIGLPAIMMVGRFTPVASETVMYVVGSLLSMVAWAWLGSHIAKRAFVRSGDRLWSFAWRFCLTVAVWSVASVVLFPLGI